MAWEIRFEDKAQKFLNKVDKSIKIQILKYLNKVSNSLNPKYFGKPLVANLNGLWRYRVGDYRIICNIQDDTLLILVIDINHRSEIYN